ncbi:polyprenyl diphosphate synthase [Plantactinospora sp. KBS50]|uniref:polyprenyl diphosphate synthase n=1 Tax=Plantactinospora sp. KBS50 TaxID=2024580 RepID=UPI000BAB0234|nr:polyprenyl diphosphate synthase [Plantactinospora sp. KBS50]ASW55221.1 di-trans,poly-cis-decaprenylcistransferase [Plantactinospora sp. KBS50]
MQLIEPVRRLGYALYARRLRRRLPPEHLPRHIGVILDGNRRWARHAGLANPGLGHRAGAERVEKLLSWCQQLGIRHVSLFVCSTENLRRRDATEIAHLMRLLEQVVADTLARPAARWRLHVVGDPGVLPDSTAHALKRAVEATRDCASGAQLTLAIGYGGRQEVVEALRQLLAERADAGEDLGEVASTLSVEDIARHLGTAGRPDPDLIIRTSGEQRMSNFLLWQGAYAELYFCEAYWPAFREIDLLRALRSYAARDRRSGG